ncbi:MAG: cadherin repeat domain-containing protein, partial [Pseudomonadota bacterium]
AKSSESPSVFAYSDPVPVTVNVNGRPTGITLSGSQTAPETKNNFSVGTLGAADPDGDTVTNFALVPGPDAGNFRIDNGVLKTNTASLNYENTADRTQQIRIRATDAGGLSVEQDFTITLSDINEKPEWTGALAGDFSVDENIDIGSLNINLSGATDPENANVYYYFLLENGTVSGNPGGHLSINATTGQLSGQFDYEQIKDQGYFNESGGYVEVRYLATDKAISGTAIDYRADENYTTYTDVKRAAPQTLRITVNNVKDNLPVAPTISGGVPTLSETQTGASGNGTLIKSFSGPSTDAEGDAVAYRVRSVSGALDDKFQIIGNGIYLKPGQSVDFETFAAGSTEDTKELSIQIEAYETATPSRTSAPVNFTFNLASQNEHNPTLDYTGSRLVTENFNFTAGDTGVTLTAADTDIGEGGDLTFSTADSRVSVDPESGVVSYNQGFNWEALLDEGAGNNRFADVVFSVSDEYSTTNLTVRFEVVNTPEPQALFTVDAAGMSDFFNISSVYPQYTTQSLSGFAHALYLDGIHVAGFAYYAFNDTFVATSATAGHSWSGRTLIAPDEITPIILDLDGDGVEMTSLSSTPIWFDQNDDGRLDQTGWVGADDALLVLDRNGNGAIDGGAEISFVQDLPGATTDMEGLVAYDTNGDGVFDGGDADFGRFQLWQDANADGVSQAEELTGLTESGIAGIDLALTPTGQTLENTPGNVMFNTAEFIRADGTRGGIGDVAFRYIPGEADAQSDSGRSNQMDAATPVAEVETQRALQSIIQAMATFGGDTGAAAADPLQTAREQGQMFVAADSRPSAFG